MRKQEWGNEGGDGVNDITVPNDAAALVEGERESGGWRRNQRGGKVVVAIEAVDTRRR